MLITDYFLAEVIDFWLFLDYFCIMPVSHTSRLALLSAMKSSLKFRMQRTHLSKEKIIVTYKSSFTLKRNQITSQDYIWNKKQQKTTQKNQSPSSLHWSQLFSQLWQCKQCCFLSLHYYFGSIGNDPWVMLKFAVEALCQDRSEMVGFKIPIQLPRTWEIILCSSLVLFLGLAMLETL